MILILKDNINFLIMPTFSLYEKSEITHKV